MTGARMGRLVQITLVTLAAYILLTTAAGILFLCAPVWMAILVFLGALWIAFRPEVVRVNTSISERQALACLK